MALPKCKEAGECEGKDGMFDEDHSLSHREGTNLKPGRHSNKTCYSECH